MEQQKSQETAAKLQEEQAWKYLEIMRQMLTDIHS